MPVRIPVLTLFLILVPVLALVAQTGQTLPRVVLIGDSIRMHFAPEVKRRLQGRAEVIDFEENGEDTANVLKHLDAWAINMRPDIIHINAGLHDLKLDRKTGKHQVELAQYRVNLTRILERLTKETRARIIFARTTPVLQERHRAKKGFDRLEDDVRAYNAAADEVLARFPDVRVDDLYSFAMSLGLEQALGPDGVHFTEEGRAQLGVRVAEAILSVLEPEARLR